MRHTQSGTFQIFFRCRAWNRPQIFSLIEESPSEPAEDFLEDQLYSRRYFDDVEDRDEYKPGGFHPIHLGDYLGKDNRFKVIHKLGNGGLATVWLCRDCEKSNYVALKIIIADTSSDDSPELKLVNRKDLDFGQPRGKHIALSIDHFWVDGPNGSHLCMVLSVLGLRIPVIWSTFPNPSKLSRDIALQVTSCLRFLHQNGICHGDFRPANFLLRLSGIDSLSEEQIIVELGEPRMEPLLTASGASPGPSAPKYIVQPINLEVLDPKYLTDQACIIDFGQSYEISSPLESLGIPIGYGASELIFDNSIGVSCDIWSLACIVYELRSMRQLFETLDGTDGEVIFQMVKLLGKLPEPWCASWNSREHWFDEDGRPVVDPSTGKAVVNLCAVEDLLAQGVYFRIGDANGRPVDITVPVDEREILANLLRMLKYDTQSRATIESIIDHPWFKL